MEDNKLSELYESVINIDKNKLVSYLKCPLCTGIFRTPFTINECMHTFCKSCIFKFFHLNPLKDYCPVCEMKLGGKPLETLIFDHSIAVLIEILFPEFEVLDKEAMKEMYKIFRDNKQSLPGDEEIMKSQKPSIKIVLQPLILEESENILPKLEYSQLTLQPNMIIESLKKYIKKKLESKIDPDYDVSITYKNIEMLDHYTIKDIERIYSFTGEKTIFYYYKKPSISTLNSENKLNKNASEINANINNNDLVFNNNANIDDPSLSNNQIEEENKILNEKENSSNYNINQEIINKISNNNENDGMNIDLNN